MQPSSNVIERIFTGPDRYTVGIIFMFANLASFFVNMRKLQFKDSEALLGLVLLAFSARLVA